MRLVQNAALPGEETLVPGFEQMNGTYFRMILWQRIMNFYKNEMNLYKIKKLFIKIRTEFAKKTVNICENMKLFDKNLDI